MDILSAFGSNFDRDTAHPELRLSTVSCVVPNKSLNNA
jgi:hypothetical protein